ncbi:MAG TPA: TrbC/VirB2 family protein [Candidatus Saccharimonadales bacterium]|nr:TrbC/VirB2 family protein [Candidatus Saccharimonadales bacterium]
MKTMLFYLLAANGKIDPNQIGLKNPVKNADTALQAVLNTVYIWAGIIAVLVIIIAGIMYSVSQGEQAKITRAKDMIVGAVIGLVVIMMAFVITQFVIGRF